MRIAIVVDRFPVITETFIIDQINKLINSGNSVDVFAYNRTSSTMINQPEGLKMIDHVCFKEKMPKKFFARFLRFCKLIYLNRFRLNLYRLCKSLNLFRFGKEAISLRLFFQSFWFLKDVEYDVIHAHFGHVGLNIAQLKDKGFIKSTKLVITLHGYFINEKMITQKKQDYLVLFKIFDEVIVNSHYSWEILKKYFPQRKIHILPVGLNTSFFKKNGETQNATFQIVFCGRLTRLKGPDLTIEIFRELVSRNKCPLQLEIIGDGEMKEELLKQVEVAGLTSSVNFRGYLNQEEIRKILNQSHVLIMPGIKDYAMGKAETQGLVIQEAQSMEIPVVISDVGGMKYGILNDLTGFVVKEADIVGFANCLEYLINNPLLRLKMGKSGRKFVVDNYDVSIINDQLLGIYKATI